MWPVTGEFLAALGQSHTRISRIDAYQGGFIVGTVPFSEGKVDVTARNRIRRTLNLTVPASLYPTEADSLLSPYATVLQAWCGMKLGGVDVLLPVFSGRIESVENTDQYGGNIELRARDLMGDVVDARFEEPRAAPTGMRIFDAIAALVREAVPTATLVVGDGVDNTSVIPSGLMWDVDRAEAVDSLAQSIGCEAFAGPDGVFQLRKVPTLDDPVSWTANEGSGGTLVTAGRTVSREGVYNVVITTVERANGDLPLRFVAEDDNRDSPTYVGGLFGRVPRFLRNPLVTNADQGRAAGTALLARSIGATRLRTITCVPNPAAEAGDVINATVEGLVETHIADTFSLPLHAEGGAMAVGTRSTKPDAGDL